MCFRKLSCHTVAFAVALLLSGCPPIAEVSFYNDTGKDVTVSWSEARAVVAAHSSTIIRSPKLPREFTVSSEIFDWHYKFVVLPEDFTYPDFDFGLRLESNGYIFAVQPSTVKLRYDKQPSEYPLRPQ